VCDAFSSGIILTITAFFRVQKAFKVRLQPNQKQQTQINKTIGCARFVYNRFLHLRKELYETEKKTLTYNGCSQQLTQLKKELSWLTEVDKFALQNSLKNLETAYKNFFEGIKKLNRVVGYPKFKKKHGFKQSYKTNFTNNNIEVREQYLKLPKLGLVKFNKSRTRRGDLRAANRESVQEITGKLINVTVSRTKNGHYMASILCETEIEKYPDSVKELGLDLGLKSYLIKHTGEEIENPKYYKKHLRKLRCAHKNLSRRKR
jgi:putative transposase